MLQPAFGGGQFSILFGVAILRGAELGPQGDDLRLAGATSTGGNSVTLHKRKAS